MSWTEFVTIKDIEVEVGGVVRFLQAEIWIKKDREYNFGADADGRGGITAEVINDSGFEGIWDLETGDDVTEQFKNDADVWNQIERKM